MSNSHQFGLSPIGLIILGVIAFFLYRAIRKNKKNAIYILIAIAGFSALIAFAYIFLRNTTIFSYIPLFTFLAIIVLLGIARNPNKKDKGKIKGSAFMTMMSLKNPVLLLSPKRRELTENYFKDLTNNKDDNRVKSSETYLDILNERYAKGEIDKDEYKRIRADIEK